MRQTDFDFIVAGSGAGGAAVAARLAEGGARTLLLEQGNRAVPQSDANAAVSLYYANAGLTAAVGNALLPVAVGRTLGGTTTINSGTCLRPPPAVVERWRATPGFDADDFFNRVEEAWKALHVKKTAVHLASASSRAFLDGLGRLGIGGGHLLDRAEDGCTGGGRCCFVCPTGAKMTSQKAFLDPQASNERLKIWEGARLVDFTPADRPGAPVTVAARENAGRRKLTCRSLILSCGALATPYYLRRLRPAAGDELTVHPAAKVFALFDDQVNGWKGVPQAAGLEDTEEPRLRFEGAFVPPEIAPLTMPLEGRRLRWWLERYDRVASFGFMVKDNARGTVRYPLGRDTPVIRYNIADEDVRLLARGMRTVAQVFFAAGANRVLLPLNRTDNELPTPGSLERFDFDSVTASQLQMMGFHPLGTAGLGRVVDGNLRAAEGVYVCDGSVVPESLGVNPQITIYAFALGLAARLLAAHGN